MFLGVVFVTWVLELTTIAMNRGGELDGLLPEKENITVNECLPQINSTILHFIHENVIQRV